MSNISESITLLGLVVTTIPFEFEDNVVTANISINVDIEQLEQIKSDLKKRKDEEALDDKEYVQLSDDIYLISRILENLK